MNPPFKIGDRVVCVNDNDCSLALHGVYKVYELTQLSEDCYVSIRPDDASLYLASRFTLEQPATTPDDYPDSVEDYAHNKPHVVIAYGAGTLLMILTFFAGLWLGWWLL